MYIENLFLNQILLILVFWKQKALYFYQQNAQQNLRQGRNS